MASRWLPGRAGRLPEYVDARRRAGGLGRNRCTMRREAPHRHAQRSRRSKRWSLSVPEVTRVLPRSRATGGHCLPLREAKPVFQSIAGPRPDEKAAVVVHVLMATSFTIKCSDDPNQISSFVKNFFRFCLPNHIDVLLIDEVLQEHASHASACLVACPCRWEGRGPSAARSHNGRALRPTASIPPASVAPWPCVTVSSSLFGRNRCLVLSQSLSRSSVERADNILK